MTLDSVDTLFFTLAFLVPGFIMHKAVALSVPQRSENWHLLFLRFLALSCVNYALWSWLVYLIYKWAPFGKYAWLAAVAWFWIIFVAPGSIGVLLGYLNSKDVIRRGLQRLGFTPLHSIATSWDYKFSRVTQERWVSVTLKDGSTVCGLFGSSSFASSAPAERDVYLERVYHVIEGSWQPIERQDGILIAGDQIRYIEFIAQ